MKKILLLLLILPAVFAQTWLQAASITTQLNVSGDIEITTAGPSPYVDTLTADVMFIPKNTPTSAVRHFEATPAAILTNERATFIWKNPTEDVSFKYMATVETAYTTPNVKARIPYPITTRGMEQHLKPTKHIDSTNPSIKAKALELKGTDDDLFVIVTNIAGWVKGNVEYNLSTLTAEVSQPASWVLQNKYGVCDELTSLFIAMLRSLGIPARFVSGIAFTNHPSFPAGWGAHGWAEVYFPGTGWVPYDVTFGQYGWLDPGHIKMKESNDPQEPTTVYEWKARDVAINVHDLDIDAHVQSSSGRIPPEAQVSVTPLYNRAGFGSYNGLRADITNSADHYAAMELTLTKVAELTAITPATQYAIVPPGSTAQLFWIVKVNDALDNRYQYTMPLQVTTPRNDTYKTSFTTGPHETTHSQQDIESIIQQAQQTTTEPFILSCTLERDVITNDNGIARCTIKNNKQAATFNICAETCTQVTVEAGATQPAAFDVHAPAAGSTPVKITATGHGATKTATLTLMRLDEPSISITDIALPQEVTYGEHFLLTFTLTRDSVAYPQNVTVTAKGSGAKATINAGELAVTQEVTINMNSGQLFSGTPKFKITATHYDDKGKKYTTTETATLNVMGVPWWKGLFAWIFDLV